MAMTLRIPAHLDAALDALAESQHSSKSAIVMQAIEEHLRRELKTQAVLASVDETSRDYADLITRLEDA
jgi:predicted transcriptional regulator